ncbi:MAG: phosphotransferase family protein [Rhodospirillales bacterium]
MQGDREVIPVRADERLDTTRLEPWLRAHLPDASGPFSLAQFGGGHANLTYLVQFGDTAYVLRRPPLGPIAPSAHDMQREHRVLRDLWQAFALAPRSFAVCEDDAIIGVPFHVMERRLGIVIRTQLPDDRDWTPDLNVRVGNMLVDVLAGLHCADPDAAGLGDLGRPEGFIERQLTGWSKRWVAARHEDNPHMQGIIAWLERELPVSQKVSLLHNDFKLDNMLLDAADPGRATAVLDWDMCTRGDPLVDLGYTLTFWGQSDDDPAWIQAASMPTWNPGFPDRDAVIERYARATGLNCDDVHWYQVFGVFKIAVILQQIYIRYLRGQTRDERFAVFGKRIAGLIDKGRVLARL